MQIRLRRRRGTGREHEPPGSPPLPRCAAGRRARRSRARIPQLLGLRHASRRLSWACEHCGVPLTRPHHADADADAAGALFDRYARLAEAEGLTLRELRSRAPRSACARSWRRRPVGGAGGSDDVGRAVPAAVVTCLRGLTAAWVAASVTLTRGGRARTRRTRGVVVRRLASWHAGATELRARGASRRREVRSELLGSADTALLRAKKGLQEWRRRADGRRSAPVWETRASVRAGELPQRVLWRSSSRPPATGGPTRQPKSAARGSVKVPCVAGRPGRAGTFVRAR